MQWRQGKWHHYKMCTSSWRKPKALKASEFLQFLWRDLTSDFDVIRPYYSSHKGMESKFVISCLMTSIHAFHIHGFETMAVVCDGASANLKAMKYLTTEQSGVASTTIQILTIHIMLSPGWWIPGSMRNYFSFLVLHIRYSCYMYLNVCVANF